MSGAGTAGGVAGTADAAGVVELRDVTVAFPRRAEPALRRVGVRVDPGEQVVVLGPSGSGKSTVLHVVTGVVPHAVHALLTGEVTVGRTADAGTPVVERSRHLGVLAQDPAAAVCLPRVDQEVALPLENHAVAPERIGALVDEALATVGARHLRERATAELSGGEAQRVALAAALVTGPDVLLLDEPTSMLDPAGVASVRSAVATAVARHRPAVVLVEHRLDEWAGTDGVGGLPARAVALDADGTVVADGPTRVVLREHAAALHAAGCWLPLDAELLAVTGVDGGLAAPANRDHLRALATADRPPVDRDTAAPPVLTARDLAVGRGGPTAGRRRPRRRRSPRAPASPAVLGGIDLDVRPGEVVALLGANGVGKTTLLLTLAGLLPAHGGRVDGPRAGMVFQDAAHGFVAHTVAAEIAHGLDPEVAARVVPAAMRRHRLGHLAGASPFRLSGGEQRRLSLAAMLAHDRAVLLADEPTLGLDRRDTIATVGTLRAAATRGTAVVLSSHDLRTVVAVADRVVVLAGGGVLADGPTVPVLRDAGVLARAGLVLPPLVAWLIDHVPAAAVAPVLRRLDDAVVVAAAHRGGRAARAEEAPTPCDASARDRAGAVPGVAS